MTTAADGPYDVVFSEANPAGFAAELNHCLGFKGYCVIDASIGEDKLEEATDEAVDMKRAGKLSPPPQQVVDGILGPEGTRELAWLQNAADEDFAEGDALRAAAQHLASVTDATSEFCYDWGVHAGLTKTLVVRGGEVTEELVDLDEEECTKWLGIFTQAKLMFIYILGPGEGSLELQPFDDESGAVEIQTRPGMIIVLRADLMLHRHVSSIDDFALVCWIEKLNASGTRGWQEVDDNLVKAMPAVKDLVDWMQERLQAIMAMEADEKLDENVPREWLQMAHHSYFRNEKNPVAVRGHAGHLPGPWDAETSWKFLNSGTDFVTEVPLMRWDHSSYYDPAPDSWTQSLNFRPPTHVRTNVKHVAFIEGVDLFDTKFFGISPMEAKGMDPMQKHILETTYEALHEAGYIKKSLMNAYIAVFTGCAHPEWNYIDKEAGACSGTGSSQAITSNRTSFVLGMMGPSSSIDCDMSSASVALMVGSAAVATTNQRRVESQGNSQAAAVGGVYLGMTPFIWPRFNLWMNPNGRCFTFDEAGNGYVRGEMCGSVCLKPYAEKVDNQLVIADQPCIGCVSGWRMISNGRGASMTAPHGPAEQECVFDAIRDACIDARDIDGVDCHGSGGLLDDSIEVSSLAAVLRGMPGGEKEALMLGAVKTHVGAQCEACGMSAFLKILHNIAFANNAPSLHLKTLNPHIEMGEGAVMMNSEAVAYRGRSAYHGFSSRGLGGTMVHGILWYTADSRKVRTEKPGLDRQVFNFWPGGGGMLEAGSKASSAYSIVGSWSEWESTDEMTKADDGSFSFVVTLGVNRVESFQIWLDGENDRVLHPDVPDASSGSVVYGPSDAVISEGFRWTIDGRRISVPSGLSGDAAPGSLAVAGSVLQPVSLRDEGRPGDQYKVKLMIAGKYRAVSWHKIDCSAIADAGSLMPLITGRYYVAGAWNHWAFTEMTESAPGSNIYTADVSLGFGSDEFIIVRNKDWEQAFYPAAPGSSAVGAGASEAVEVAGPDGRAGARAWRLGGRSGDSFQIEFQRSVEGDRDEKKVSWRRHART